MYIQPNTTIKFLQNIPFDADYNDTVYFYPSEGQAGQAEYFDSFTKYTINENYYQRVNKGELKVQLPYSTGVQYESTAEKLYDCNYMMFRNTNFGNKWFYAFIKNVEWVNNETAKITYELDVMQTWFFDYDLEQCFVEREHSATDEIGDNRVPENLEMGYDMVVVNDQNTFAEYVPVPINENELKMGWTIVMLVSRLPENYDEDHPDKSGFNQDGPLASGLRCLRFNNCKLNSGSALRNSDYFFDGDLDEFLSLTESYLDNTQTNLTPDDIATMYLTPTWCAYSSYVHRYSETITIPRVTSLGERKEVTHDEISVYEGYFPNNKKLFCYPFVQLCVSNSEGDIGTFKPDYFYNNSPVFQILGSALYAPTLVCSPVGYLPTEYVTSAPSPTTYTGVDGYEYAISSHPNIQCPWVGDAFKAWWAQNKNSVTSSTAISVLAGLVTTGIGIALATPTGGASTSMSIMGMGMIGSGLTSAGGSIAKTVSKMNDIKNSPPSISGLSNNSTFNAIYDRTGFRFSTKTITQKQAKIIDDYFTMFGYACHEVKTPNRHARPHWTYTQTVGCTIKARCPGDDQKKICQIYDKGIRFWAHDTNTEIGKYYNANGTPIDNSPTAG